MCTVEWGPPAWKSSVLLCHFIWKWVPVCRRDLLFIQSFKERKSLTKNLAFLFWCAGVAHIVAHYTRSWGWKAGLLLLKKESHAGSNCSCVMIRVQKEISFQLRKIKPSTLTADQSLTFQNVILMNWLEKIDQFWCNICYLRLYHLKITGSHKRSEVTFKGPK